MSGEKRTAINTMSQAAIAVVAIVTAMVLFVDDLYSYADDYENQLLTLEGRFVQMQGSVDARFADFDNRLDTLSGQFSEVRQSNEDIWQQINTMLERQQDTDRKLDNIVSWIETQQSQ